MSEHRRILPARPDLSQQRKLAKELLRAHRSNEPVAVARVRAFLPHKEKIGLADAQFVLAREYGFPTWAALRTHIDAVLEQLAPVRDRFRRAVERLDDRGVRRLLNEHAELRSSINETTFDFGASALLVAAPASNPALVDVLLEYGADPNRRSDWAPGGFHPLHVATPEAAERLLRAGANPDACSAAHLDRFELLERLLIENPARVHERGGDGQTPLHFARSESVVDLLLRSGADIDARDEDHQSTPAEWMLSDADDPARSRLSLARYLVDRGARVDIFLAAALGLSERARALIAADPDVLSLRTGQGAYGERPPVSSYHIYLWAIGPNLTPLQTAARFGQLETLRLMETLASPQQRLLLACHQGDAQTAEAIVAQHPAIVSQLNESDRRSLTDEAWSGNAPAVEVMLSLGFDPSVPSVTGPTGGNALHCAAWQGSVACVSALLRSSRGRALVNARESTYGGTPLSWCCHGSRNCTDQRADHAECARLLIGAGAIVSPELDSCADPMQEVLASHEVTR